MENHRQAHLRSKDKCMLYMSNKLGRCFPNWKNKSKLTKLFDIGNSRIERELNIVYLVKTLRHLKIMLKTTLMRDHEVRLNIKHDHKNLIQLSEENFDDVEEFDSILHAK